MINLVLVGLITLFFHGNSWSLPLDKTQPVIIKADTAFIDALKGIGHYTGNVRVQQGTTLLIGQAMTTYTNPIHQLTKLVIKGNSTEQAIYQTQPQLSKPTQIIASAQSITFLIPEQRVILVGNAKTQQGEDHIAGPYLEYDSIKQQFNAHNPLNINKPEQTTIMIQPETLFHHSTLQRLTANTTVKEIIAHG